MVRLILSPTCLTYLVLSSRGRRIFGCSAAENVTTHSSNWSYSLLLGMSKVFIYSSNLHLCTISMLLGIETLYISLYKDPLYLQDFGMLRLCTYCLSHFHNLPTISRMVTGCCNVAGGLRPATFTATTLKLIFSPTGRPRTTYHCLSHNSWFASTHSVSKR